MVRVLNDFVAAMNRTSVRQAAAASHRRRHIVSRWAAWRPSKLIRAGKAEVGTLVVMLLFAALCLGFARLTDEMVEGETRPFDHAILLAMRTPGHPDDPRGPAWFEESVRDITSFGSTAVVTAVSLTVVGFLALSGAPGAALLVLVSVGGGELLTHVLKELFARTRPDLVPHAARVFTHSFPSGHATLSAVAYLTMGALLARVQTSTALKAYSLAVAIGLTLLVGVSRVYLGLHWPTDVLAGWCVGAAWAIACWFSAAWLQRRGRVERHIEAA